MALNDITARFLSTVTWLITEKKAQDKKDIAVKLGISTSLMTEITKGRSNVGVIPLQNIVLKYDVSADWLLTGEGAMLKTDQPTGEIETPLQKPSNDLVTPLLDRIDSITRENERLKIENARLESELERMRSSATDAHSEPSARAV